MKILFTGASSFTGFWLVQALVANGHEVICPITRSLENYTGTRSQRLKLLQPICRLIPNASFGSETFFQLIQHERFDTFGHHAAAVTNYKSPDFDASAALKNNTHQLPLVLQTLRERGLTSVVLTGTYFEANEGTGSSPLRTFSPYSLSKTLTFEAFLQACAKIDLALGKFVLPNPFGPWEEPRFTAFLMNQWKAGKLCEVKTPEYLRDNLHVDLLAATYAKFVATVAAEKSGCMKMNPSGYVETQGEFAQRVAREVRSRLGWACELNLAKQEDFSEPLQRANTQSATKMVPEWNEAKAWDAFVNFYAA